MVSHDIVRCLIHSVHSFTRTRQDQKWGASKIWHNHGIYDAVPWHHLNMRQFWSKLPKPHFYQKGSLISKSDSHSPSLVGFISWTVYEHLSGRSLPPAVRRLLPHELMLLCLFPLLCQCCYSRQDFPTGSYHQQTEHLLASYSSSWSVSPNECREPPAPVLALGPNWFAAMSREQPCYPGMTLVLGPLPPPWVRPRFAEARPK